MDILRKPAVFFEPYALFILVLIAMFLAPVGAFADTTNLLVTADDMSRAYGATNPVLTYTITDTNGVIVAPADLMGTPTLTTTADVSSVVGSYVINCATGALSASNCVFTAVNGTLTITRATHAATNGYITGIGTVQTGTIDCAFYYPTNTSLNELLWLPTLPTTWILLAASGDGSPEVKTNDVEILFTGALTSNPVVFQYTVRVPANESAGKSLRADMEYTLEGMVNPTNIWADPDPLPIPSTPGTVTQGTHTCVGYYSPSTNMVVSNSFAYPSDQTLTNLVWSPILPNTNWTLITATGDGNPSIIGSNITFGVPLTNRPVNFTYKVNVPGNQAVSNIMNASISFAYSGSGGQTTAPDPLTIFRYHSADYQAPKRKIDTSEVGRVLAYWRTGNYQPNAIRPDGYEATTNVYTGPDTGRHSADYQTPLWKIDTSEIGRALAYWRTGGYAVDLTKPDGYKAATNGPGPI